MTALALSPSGVPALPAARSRSPVEICGTFNSCLSSVAWVPLPEPFGPKNTMRMVLGLVRRYGRRASDAMSIPAPRYRVGLDFRDERPAKLTARARRVKLKVHNRMSQGNLLYAQ